MRSLSIFLLLLLLRIGAVFVVRTWFIADEYWQSLEVAHKWVFGYGHLTWEWRKSIGSFLYPSIIAAIYKVLQLLQLDEVNLLILIPRIIQATLTAFADYRFYKWCNNSKWSLYLIVTAWFWFYTGSRTLPSTFEACLTTIALSYYPWKSESSVFIWPLAFLFYVCPTATIPWIVLCIRHLRSSKYRAYEILFKRYFVIGIIVSLMAIGIDCFAYGKFILTPLQYLKSVSIYGYGESNHPWYWYLTTGLPILLGMVTVPFLLAVNQTIRNRKLYPERITVLIAILFTLTAFSLFAHKEIKLIVPLLSMCLFITSDFLSKWSYRASKLSIWIVTLAILIGNIVPATYLSVYHQRGPIDVMQPLQKISQNYRDENGHRPKLFFLMPCYSTPFYSYIHENVNISIIPCNPNFNQDNNYLDDTTKFYTDQMGWIRSHIPIHPKTAMPTHLILFDNIVDNVTDFLIDYKETHRLYNCEYPFDRIGKHILIYERISSTHIYDIDSNNPTAHDN